jgi:hypothetical protein
MRPIEQLAQPEDFACLDHTYREIQNLSENMQATFTTFKNKYESYDIHKDRHSLKTLKKEIPRFIHIGEQITELSSIIHEYKITLQGLGELDFPHKNHKTTHPQEPQKEQIVQNWQNHDWEKRLNHGKELIDLCTATINETALKIQQAQEYLESRQGI